MREGCNFALEGGCVSSGLDGSSSSEWRAMSRAAGSTRSQSADKGSVHTFIKQASQGPIEQNNIVTEGKKAMAIT